jgi:hypothetical protein
MAETLTPAGFTISKAPSETALDHAALYDVGLAEVRRLAAHVWTDHNVHDPGVTALELLSYAITDVALRASRPIEDLLTDDTHATTSQFKSARTLLPNRPLTIRDYRKLLIDLKDVRNAWLRPAPLTYFVNAREGKLVTTNAGGESVRPVSVQGLYEVRVEYTDAVVTPEKQAEVNRRVLATLQVNRNLCEDFVALVIPVERQRFQICGEIELEPGRGQDASSIQAQIFFDVQQYLAPDVRNYSLAEMREATKPDGSKYQVEEIFDGPALANGFIKDHELDASDIYGDDASPGTARRLIRLSDIISIVMDVPGVRAVRDFLITPVGEPVVEGRWVIPVEENRQPTLARNRSRLVYSKDGVPVVPDRELVERKYERLTAEATAKVETERLDDLPIPLGRARHLERYYSLQNHFPATYGIGEDGLESGADARRHALALQLKAYLLVFDQILANFCAQVANLRELFSTSQTVDDTYFYQVVNTLRGYERLYNVALETRPADQSIDGFILTALKKKFDEARDVHDDRRHRFLDHLISRYAERFHEYAAAVQSAIGTSSRLLQRHKCRFLDSYPDAAGRRGAAYDYTAPAPWNSSNVSGLEQRLALLLDINGTRRDLSVVPDHPSAQVFSPASGDHRFRIVNDAGTVILRAPFAFASEAEALAAMQHALTAAQRPPAYRRIALPDGTRTFTVRDAAEAIVAEGGVFADEASLELAIDDTVELVRQRFGRESLLLIENILLRSTKDELLLRVCTDSNCEGCADDDPYSYRVHVILPADAGRFEKTEFRDYVESVIRAETPAHILPKICWVGADDQKAVEKTYRAWLEDGAGGDSPALARLRDALENAKCVYGPARLTPCNADGLQTFLLGRHRLGPRDSGNS